MGSGLAYQAALSGTAAAEFAAAAIATVAFGVLAGVVITVAVGIGIYKRLSYVRVRNIDSYEEVLDLAICEAKAWKSPQKSDEATMPMEQQINKEHELKCQGFNLVKPYPFQSDVV
jgi:hypothetical protein